MCTTSLAGVRLLLVDDDEMVREAVHDFLVDCGAIVVTVDSARAALAAFRASPPDVLISDLRMPGEDGFWLISAIRKLPCAEGRNVPAVAVTGDIQAAPQALAAGFQAVHGKPPRLAELSTLLAGLAGRHAA